VSRGEDAGRRAASGIHTGRPPSEGVQAGGRSNPHPRPQASPHAWVAVAAHWLHF